MMLESQGGIFSGGAQEEDVWVCREWNTKSEGPRAIKVKEAGMRDAKKFSEKGTRDGKKY